MRNNYLSSLIELNLSKNNKLKTNTSSQSSESSRRVSLSSASSLLFEEIKNSPIKKLAASSSRVFTSLINLRKLDLSENNLLNIPIDIKELRHLEELNLEKNQLEFLPNELTELRSLCILKLAVNRIGELNDQFCYHAQFRRQLVKLDLRANRLRNDTFSTKIGLFEKLEYIDLSENLFESVPSTLPKSLIELRMRKNRIRSLLLKPLGQNVISDDELMKALRLEIPTTKKKKRSFENDVESSAEHSRNKTQKMRNLLKLLSPDTESIISPKHIDYDQPDIDRTEELFLSHPFFLRHLKILDLSNNSIVDVPADFGILNSSLETLLLAQNSIIQFGTSLCRGFSQLRHLDLSHNRIRDLNDKIRELASLESLNLSFNQLATVNQELCFDLKNLRELNLSNNCLENLPHFLVLTSAQNVKSGSKKSAESESRSGTPHSNLSRSPSNAG